MRLDILIEEMKRVLADLVQAVTKLYDNFFSPPLSLLLSFVFFFFF